jgi:hypothetical protein
MITGGWSRLRMVPADMGKLQAVHKLAVKSHRINLEVEFIVERLAPEARPVAVRVHDCRQRRMDRSVFVDGHGTCCAARLEVVAEKQN